MIIVKNNKIDFSLGSPRDLRRLYAAREAAGKREIHDPPSDQSAPDYLLQCADWYDAVLRSFGNYLDDAFGDGVATMLLTNNPSLEEMIDINAALEVALGEHVKGVNDMFSVQPIQATQRQK